MLSQLIHQHHYSQLLARVRRRSAILIFFALSAFFAINPTQKSEICNNGIDDNKDGWIDCQDPICQGIFEDCLREKEK